MVASADLRRIVGKLIKKNSPRKGDGGEEKDRSNWKGGEIRWAGGLQAAVLSKGVKEDDEVDRETEGSGFSALQLPSPLLFNLLCEGKKETSKNKKTRAIPLLHPALRGSSDAVPGRANLPGVTSKRPPNTRRNLFREEEEEKTSVTPAAAGLGSFRRMEGGRDRSQSHCMPLLPPLPVMRNVPLAARSSSPTRSLCPTAAVNKKREQ